MLYFISIYLLALDSFIGSSSDSLQRKKAVLAYQKCSCKHFFLNIQFTILVELDSRGDKVSMLTPEED